ncbi:hypothetical protein BD311DRAFT_752434 [Dichomitus squalens]|uniref:Uncharacterized protein n=1 Tax=Dichomitus squalens TaxID=114155 RepID=A0A4Q9MTV9_9APHY|nr:hypothetical protein BD311DRAFT_752434 [Dichomitus squalens]
MWHLVAAQGNEFRTTLDCCDAVQSMFLPMACLWRYSCTFIVLSGVAAYLYCCLWISP